MWRNVGDRRWPPPAAGYEHRAHPEEVPIPTARPLVSVVVPVRDDAVRLRRCLAALAAQTLPASDYEVLVVDNGSADDPAAALAACPGARLLREPTPGSYAARNRGLAAARAPVLAFTDADCRPAPDWLARALGHLRRRPEIDGVAGLIEVEVASRRSALERYDALTGFPQRHFVERYGFGATANLVVRRAAFDRVGGFDSRLRSGGDAEWGERASAAGCRMVFAPDVVVAHPARRRLAQLAEKARRTTRGVEQLAAQRAVGAPLLPALGRHLARPWQETAALWRAGALPAPAAGGFLAVALLAAALRAGEVLRCRVSGDARRWRSAQLGAEAAVDLPDLSRDPGPGQLGHSRVAEPA